MNQRTAETNHTHKPTALPDYCDREPRTTDSINRREHHTGRSRRASLLLFLHGWSCRPSTPPFTTRLSFEWVRGESNIPRWDGVRQQQQRSRRHETKLPHTEAKNAAQLSQSAEDSYVWRLIPPPLPLSIRAVLVYEQQLYVLCTLYAVMTSVVSYIFSRSQPRYSAVKCDEHSTTGHRPSTLLWLATAGLLWRDSKSTAVNTRLSLTEATTDRRTDDDRGRAIIPYE